MTQIKEYAIPLSGELNCVRLNYLIYEFCKQRSLIPIRCVLTTPNIAHVSVLKTPRYSKQINHFPLHLSDRENVFDNGFSVALLIPTGLGATLGGHAGDAGSVARLMASVCDTLITHPNVVNASDINEMTDNTLYVEGHLLLNVLLGRAALQRVRSNRVLVVVDGSAEGQYVTAAINSVNAARASYGFNCSEVVVLKSPYVMTSYFGNDERATGRVTNLDSLFKVLEDKKGTYDAVALTSLIGLTPEARDFYYKHGGVNPWGGIEAMLTHAVSHVFGVPCAHSPMMESVEVEQLDYGVIDPRDGAEIVSLTYLQSILKGLHNAPRPIWRDIPENISCLVIPRHCHGLPTMIASERGIPVIAVENKLKVEGIDCLEYVDAILVNNYLEAAGVVSALRSGISIESLRRPLASVDVEKV